MPNRILKDSICTSESVDDLTWFEEVLFYRLIVNCDDYGRFDARPAVIKSRLFPLKERLTTKDVSAALSKLADAGIVRTYVCKGKPYLYLPSWEDHQSIRAKRSKYPSPDDGMITSEYICKQMQADAPVIQSNPNPNPNPNPNSHARGGDGFDRFWSAYPKKVGKDAARKAWPKTKSVSIDIILAAIESQKRSAQWQKDDGQYIPNPATWLNQGRWQDEMAAATGFIDGKRRALDDDEQAAIRRMMAEPAQDLLFEYGEVE